MDTGGQAAGGLTLAPEGVEVTPDVPEIIAETLPAAVLRLLIERELTVAVAESSTGGLIGHLLTEMPGASAAFLGGVIAYAERLKVKLGVPPEVLEEHGAVSAETAKAMAGAVREWASADYGVAETSIAGPGGGTAVKPMGRTYVALASQSGTVVEEHSWTGARTENKMQTALAALALLRRQLEAEG